MKSTTSLDAATPGRLLIVGDLALSRGLMRMVLTRLGYMVSCVGSAQEASSLVGQTRYALLMIALQLPDLPGLTLARRLRGQPGATSTVPIILFGDALDQEKMLESCREARLDAYLPKPIPIARLVAVVGQLIRRAAPQIGVPLVSSHSPPIAMEQFASFTDGDKQIERELSTLFLVTARHYLDQMRAVVQTGGDWRQPAHALKGASANIGAVQLAALAVEAEGMPANKEILAGLEEALEDVRQFFSARHAEPVPAHRIAVACAS